MKAVALVAPPPEAAKRRSRKRSAKRALNRLQSLNPLPSSLRVSDDDTGETRRRKHRAAYSLYAIGSVVAGAVALVVYVFPTQTWWTQRHAEADLRTKLTILDEQNQQLAAQISRLDSDAEVIKVARGQYGLVFPNEKAFVVLPASLPDFPQAWPFNVVKAFFTVDR